MNKKTVFLIGGFGLSALALAAAVVTGARGGGEVTNAEGKKAGFRIDVTKVTDGTRVAVNGGGTFEMPFVRDGKPGVVRVRFEAREAAKTNNSFAAQGPGHMTVLYNGQTESRPGRVRVEVVDRRRANATTGERDLYRIRFAPQNTSAQPFEFGGAVTRGDVLVFMHERQP